MLPLYTLSKMKRKYISNTERIPDEHMLEKKIHGANNEYTTLCGERICENWSIRTTQREGIVTCKKCIAAGAEFENNMQPMPVIRDALKKTDYPLLRKQKKSILELSEVLHRLGSSKYADHLDGIVSFLDAIQDAVVEDGLKTEKQVFGKLE